MRKALRNKLTGSMLLAVLTSLVVLSVCLLFGLTRYGSSQLTKDASAVFTAEVLTELNTGATGTASIAATNLEQSIAAYAGRLRIGAGREYSIWDAATGELLAGSQTDARMTKNIVTAMNGAIGDSHALLSTKSDIAIPVTGDFSLVISVQDDGSMTRDLCKTAFLLLLVGSVLSLLMCLLFTRLLSTAFVESAAETAKDIRESSNEALRPAGDWEAISLALKEPLTHAQNKEKKKQPEPEEPVLQAILPYLTDGYVVFSTDGSVYMMNESAQKMLDVSFVPEETTFSQIFGTVPMPNEVQRMVHGRLTRASGRMDVIFTALENGVFAAILRKMEE